MDGTIGYLETLREDLLDAGMREHRRGGRATWGHWLRDRFSVRWLVAAATAITLLAAGSVGLLVARDGVAERERAVGRSPVEGTTGATGALDAASVQRGLESEGFVPAPAPGGDAGPPGMLPGPLNGLSRVIRTAELGLEIPPESFDDRFADAVDIASANDGFVATSTARERSGSLTIRVPASSFNETLADLRELGDVEVQTLQGRDVTAEYVDLQAWLRIAKSRREVLLRLMDRATSIAQTIRVQNALDDTQLRIEEIQGQLQLLDDRVALATIQLRLREEGVEPVEEIQAPSIPNAFERSVAGFVGVIAGIVVGLGYVIPIVALALFAWLVVSRARRRRAA